MKAIVCSDDGRLSVTERPAPAPGPGEVVIRPTFVGMSAGDLRACVQPGSQSPTPGPASVIGSELSGVVIEVGPGLDGWTDAEKLAKVPELSVGDRVSVDPRRYCGRCLQCRAGRFSTCEREQGGLGAGGIDGGLAERVVVRARNCHLVPIGVTDLQAALVAGVVRATHSIRAAGIGLFDHVGVFGLDEVGLATLQWARAITAGTVVAVDALARRRTLAARLGADLVLDPTAPDFSGAVLGSIPEGLDSVYVSVSDQLPSDERLLSLTFPVLRLQGSVVITQVVGRRVWDVMNTMPYLPLQREAMIHNTGGVAHEDPLLGGRAGGDWTATLQAFAQGRLDADGLDVCVAPFSDLRGAADVLEVLRRVPDDASKVVFAMGEVGS